MVLKNNLMEMTTCIEILVDNDKGKYGKLLDILYTFENNKI